MGVTACMLGAWVLLLDFAENAGREEPPPRGLAELIGLWPLRVTGLFWIVLLAGAVGVLIGIQTNWPILKAGAQELLLAGLGALALHFAFLRGRPCFCGPFWH